MIIQLSRQSYPAVTPLFAEIQHNIALVHAVLEGSSPGRCFADDPAHPSCALVVMEGAYSYLIGAPASEEDAQALVRCIFEDLLPSAAEKELVLFAFTAEGRARIAPLLKERGAITIQRKIFAFQPEQFAASTLSRDWRSRIPSGMAVQRIDQALAEQHPEFQLIVDPLTRRFGVCLMEGKQILSRCTAVAVGGGEAEVDIFTEEACRGLGLAAITACAFIEECLARGLRPAWACWPYREGSYLLAKKLGFEESPEAPAFFWASGM